MDRSLQIVCFNVPYPPHYGGVIDVFYKIRSLHALGVQIHLHCFEYNDFQRSEILEQFCESIHYYNRAGDILTHLSSLPFIVKSRKHPGLLKNLSKIDAPILFEGVHTAGYYNHEELAHIPKAIRMHNVESAYYKKLARWETKVVKKAYFLAESTRLANFEESIFYSNIPIISISNFDYNYFQINHRGDVNTIYPFHPYEEVASKTGSGDYIFLHGDFSISENRQWVEELAPTIVGKSDLRVKIAGKDAHRIFLQKSYPQDQLTIESNVSIERMHRLLTEAHINIVQSFNSEGFKLKLLYVLFAGRHCIANDHIIKGTRLDELVHLANQPTEALSKVLMLEKKGFKTEEKEVREKYLHSSFSNKQNAEKLMEIFEN